MAHLLVGAGFLLLGGLFQLASLIALRFPGLVPVSFGRLEPMTNLTLMIGFGAISLFGGSYYILPRLTGSRLWSPKAAAFALQVTVALVLLGLVSIGLGFGDGSQPLGLPWWVDLPLMLFLYVPAVVALGTIRRRKEPRSFVTLWFVLAGLLWLPLLYDTHLVAELPGVGSVVTAYSEVLFTAGYVTMFLITVGSGLLYYTVVKELDVPLASRQLAMVGFWSLGFAAGWWGAAQLIFGPGPDWVAGVAAALGLAFPIGAVANATNVSMTLDGSWNDLNKHPGVQVGVIGLYLTAGVSVLVAIAGFRSVASVVAGTSFWEAVEYTMLNGVGVLLIAGVVFSALPRMVGRGLESPSRSTRFQRLVLGGSVGVLISMGAAGVVSGYSWIGGSNTAAYIDAGEGWAAGLGNTNATLMLIALLFGIVVFAGQLGYVGIVFGTVSRGKAIPQEVLVDKETDHE